jgi:hypothetical protein
MDIFRLISLEWMLLIRGRWESGLAMMFLREAAATTGVNDGPEVT